MWVEREMIELMNIISYNTAVSQVFTWYERPASVLICFLNLCKYFTALSYLPVYSYVVLKEMNGLWWIFLLSPFIEICHRLFYLFYSLSLWSGLSIWHWTGSNTTKIESKIFWDLREIRIIFEKTRLTYNKIS